MIIWTPSLDVDEAAVWIGTGRKLDVFIHNENIQWANFFNNLYIYRGFVWSSLLHFTLTFYTRFLGSTYIWSTWANFLEQINKGYPYIESNIQLFPPTVFLPFLHLVSSHPFSFQVEYQMVEFFAGKGNLTRCMRLSEIPTMSLDIKYNPESCRSPPFKSNAFDVNSVSGFP